MRAPKVHGAIRFDRRPLRQLGQGAQRPHL